jgi:ribulose-5-phosphate 4-epimerase/fuculose-1-phosphate aldolase
MAAVRDQIVRLGRSLFERRLTFGRTGNISVRQGDSILVTPTGASLGALTALSTIDIDGRHVDGPAPSKEAFLHAAVYRARPTAGAVVHLHSTYSVAVSCLDGLDPADALPPLTAYYVMRVGRLPLLAYHAPGDDALGPLAERTAATHHAMLLANHGPVVAGVDLDTAADAVEELEETARLFLLLHGHRTRPLTDGQVAALQARSGRAPGRDVAVAAPPHNIGTGGGDMTIDANTYIDAVVRRVERAGGRIQRERVGPVDAVTGGFHEVSVVARGHIRFSVVIAPLATVTGHAVRDFAGQVHQWALRTTHQVPGGRTEIVNFAVLVSHEVHPDAVAAAVARPPMQGVGTTRAVVVDLAHGQMHTFTGSLLFGFALRNLIRARQQQLLPHPAELVPGGPPR